LLCLVGDTLIIADYKPDKDLGTSPGNHFINIFPQLIVYALILQNLVAKDGLNVKCVAFNNKNAVEFDPNEMFEPIRQFLNGEWENKLLSGYQKYHDDMSPKDIFVNFFSDFENLVFKKNS